MIKGWVRKATKGRLMTKLVKILLLLLCLTQSTYLLYLVNNLNEKSFFIKKTTKEIKLENEHMFNLKLSTLALTGEQSGLPLDSIYDFKKSVSRLLKDNYFWADEEYFAQKKVRELVHQTFPYLFKYDDSCFHGMWNHVILKDDIYKCLYFGTHGYSGLLLNSVDYEKYILYLNGKNIRFSINEDFRIPHHSQIRLRLVRNYVNFFNGRLEEQVDEREIDLDKLGK